MGYHADVQNGLVTFLESGLPVRVPVLNGLTVMAESLERLEAFVLVVRDLIDFDPHPPINPNETDSQQPERWTWTLDVKGGGGAKNAANTGAQVDLLLEKIRTIIGAQRPTTDCGPLHLESEEYVGQSGNGVVYRQTWWHERF